MSNTFNLKIKSGYVNYFHGAHNSGFALSIAQLAIQVESLLVVLLPDAASLQSLKEEISFFLAKQSEIPVITLPDWETLPYDYFSPHQDIISERLETLYQLPRLKRVIWGISYPSLFMKLSKSQESWRENLYSLEYDIPANRPQSIVEEMSYFNTYGLETCIKIIKSGFKIDLANSINEKGFKPVKASGKQLDETDANITARRHHGMMEIDYLHENLAYIEKTINMLKEQNVEVIFCTPPTSN